MKDLVPQDIQATQQRNQLRSVPRGFGIKSVAFRLVSYTVRVPPRPTGVVEVPVVKESLDLSAAGESTVEPSPSTAHGRACTGEVCPGPTLAFALQYSDSSRSTMALAAAQS